MGRADITGVILAGGRSTRMGEDKGLVEIVGKPLFEHIAERLAPMVGEILINSNQNQQRYGQRFEVIADLIPDHSGPLAGMLAGLKAIKTHWALFVPCDVPAFPRNLAEEFWRHKSVHQGLYARDLQREHPTLCLLNKNIIPILDEYLTSGERKVMFFFKKINALPVTFDAQDAFANLNTPADIVSWESRKGNLQ
ncbi:molybdenum cofactor guanylyltransferase MobA [Ewingella sp. S1.OA.A_B6]